MKTVVETGKQGEQKAVDFLKYKRYTILKRNHREKWGELDIIARDPDKTIVFIEVKAMSELGRSGLRPEDHLTKQKLGQLRKLALFYANNNPKIISPKKGWRIDLIALTIKDNCCDLNHYQNIG